MTHYDILEVSPKASQAVIKAAYKSLMQRFHPDKNIGDAALAQQANLQSGLITQAYDMLSDPNRRAVYDQGLGQSAALMAAPRHQRPPARTAANVKQGNASAWYFWVIVLLIIGSGSISLWLLRAKPAQKPATSPAPPAVTSQRMPEAEPVPAPTATTPAPAQPIEATVRALPWASDLSVALANGAVLSIPAITLQLGAVDPAEFTRYLDTHRALIQAQLKDRIALAKPEELALASGPQYLRRFVFDALVDITDATGARRFDLPSPTGLEATPQYGITGVLLPGAFTLK